MCRSAAKAFDAMLSDEDEPPPPSSFTASSMFGSLAFCCSRSRPTTGKKRSVAPASPTLPAQREERCTFGMCVCAGVCACLAFYWLIAHGHGLLANLDKFQRWLRHQSHQRLLLLLWMLMPLDVLPIGHAIAKPVQIAIALVFDTFAASITLFIYVFTHTMACYVIGRHCLRGCVVQYVLNANASSSSSSTSLSPSASASLSSPGKGGETSWRDWARALDRLCSDGSPSALRLVILFRLVPLPELLGSYALSVTRISLPHYVLTAVVEAVKSSILTQYVALNIRAGTRAALHVGGTDWLTLVLLLVGIVLVVLLLRALHSAVKREFLKSDEKYPLTPKVDSHQLAAEVL